VGICHCLDCRKHHGALFHTSAVIPQDAVTIEGETRDYVGRFMPASSRVHELARAVASGGTGRALQAVPPADRDKVAHAAHHAFVTGFNTIALVSVAVAAVGSVAGYALVRSRDFVGVGGQAAAPPEPA
jgi:hypothetical protein